MDIASAALLTAGCSTQPWPSMGFHARQLAPVANRPLLFHALDAIEAAGIPHATLVVDPGSVEAVRAAVGNGDAWTVAIDWVELEPRADRPLARFLELIAGIPGAVLLQEGELLLRERVAPLAASVEAQRLDGMELRAVAAGSPRHAAESLAGAFLVSPRGRNALRPDDTWDHGPAGLATLLRSRGAHIPVRSVDACLPSPGGQDGLLEANRRMLERLEPDWAEARIRRTEVQGVVVVHPSAVLENSVVRGPAIFGPGVRVVDAYVGPYTSIGPNATLQGVEIEHSIVLEGAELLHLGARVEGSVIGRNARVLRDFRVPRALRMWVGERAEVSLA